jgi:hypothetical protein
MGNRGSEIGDENGRWERGNVDEKKNKGIW